MEETQIKEALLKFTRYLVERKEELSTYSEDQIRYAFFYSIVNGLSLNPLDVQLQFRFDKSLKIDAYCPSRNIVFETKYTRKIPSGKSARKTELAGMLFNDMYRLRAFLADDTNLRRFFVYLTDREMSNYLGSPRNGFLEFWGLKLDRAFVLSNNYVVNRPDSFLRHISPDYLTMEFSVSHMYSKDISSEYQLRVFEIMH